MGFLSSLFGKEDKKVSSDHDAKPSSGFLGFGSSGPKESFSKAEVKKLNKHWGRTINKRDIGFMDFLQIADWNMNPLVPRVLEIVNATVKNAPDLSQVTLKLQDYIKVYEKLRNYQTLENKQKFAFQLVDCDGDGMISLNDLSRFYQMTTGLSDDAAEYHARAYLGGRSGISMEEFKMEVSMKDICAKFDLPPVETLVGG